MGSISGYFVVPHPPIVIPEIGKGEERRISNTTNAFEQISKEIGQIKPHVLIFITPHGPVFSDAIAISDVDEISGDLGRFGVPEVKFRLPVNRKITESIIRNADAIDIPIAPITNEGLREYNVRSELDHGCLVPLYFITKEIRDFDIVHITYGMLSKIDLYKFGMAIQKAVNENDFSAVVIASGDLSHRLSKDGPYVYSPVGAQFDREITSALKDGDIQKIFSMDRDLIEEAGECGMRSFYILSGTMDGMDVKGELLSYEGTFGVGYGILRFDTKEDSSRKLLNELIGERNKEMDRVRKKEDNYVRLARESLEYYLKHGEYIKMPEYVSEDMLSEKRGAFVSLKKNGELRGCIGTISPTTKCVATEIIRNAIEAGERDPRFMPVEENELSELVYSVDVLLPPEKANIQDLDEKKYGVIVRKGGRAGLLLPDLEGVDSVEDQLRIALNKGGIAPNENYEIERFEVIRHR